jgi:hypothetical protein
VTAPEVAQSVKITERTEIMKTPTVTINETPDAIYVIVDRHYGSGPEISASYATHRGSFLAGSR